MWVLKLILKNTGRHKLRSMLTVLGVALAIVAFGVVRTLILAWYTQAENSSPHRLVTRHAVSLTFDLPLAHKYRIEQVPGVEAVTYANWFGGIYKDKSNFFAQFACDFPAYLDMYPEFEIVEGSRDTLLAERNACMIGRKLAAKYGWKIGDLIPLTGTIYPGDYELVVRAIYAGKEPNTDESSLLFNWEYIDARMARDMPGREGRVGFFVIRLADPAQAAAVSEAVDAKFQNSTAETLTETEEAFALSFVSMSSAIITGIRIVSLLIIAIVLLVMANTMAMSARERMKEYSVLKTLGFQKGHLVGLLSGESLMLSGLGCVIGLGLLFPAVGGLAVALSDFFPIMFVGADTMGWSVFIAIVVAMLAASFPIWRVLSATITEGLRQVG
jgi:putative ABC transport system permease protein